MTVQGQSNVVGGNMLNRIMFVGVALGLFSLLSCVGRAGKGEDDLTPFALTAAFALGGMPAPATHVSTAPVVDLPSDVGLPDNVIQVTASSVELPQRIDGTFVPVGKVYDVGPDTQGQEIPGHLYLPEGGMAKLTYEYDPDELKSEGFIEEFAAFYFDAEESKWLPVDRLEVDRSAMVVRVYTRHFTPFVLTAVPAASGNIADPPACIAEDYPSGISGSAGAAFTMVDTGFKYYADRSYTINRTGSSFDSLGFNGALAISTCNGDSSCGPFANHKLNTGTNYIQFTAHTNIDLYLMYDTRGGANLFDDTRDAPWIQAAGFVNTGEFVETTDAVGKYRVYKRSYSKGDVVALDGNRAGVTAPGIQTNYWLVMKRQGITSAEPASKMCENQPSLTPPLQVSNVRIAPGSDQMILGFETPDNVDFAGVVIRRSTTAAPARVGDGIGATGTVLSPTGYRDESLQANKEYFYTIFALDRNGAYGPGVSISAKTGTDTDGDGLSDTFETSTAHASGSMSGTGTQHSDSDGVPDGTEVANGTDPTDDDNGKPAINPFLLTSASPTNEPRVSFQLDATDNIAITGWAITVTETPPVSWGSGWAESKPDGYHFRTAGAHTLYAWVKDAAGNVSMAIPSLAVNLEGINETRYAIVSISEANQVESYRVDPVTGVLTLVSTLDVPYSPYFLEAHPNGRFVYVTENGASATLISTMGVDPATGQLSLLGHTASGGTYPYSITFDATGLHMYVTNLYSNTLTWFSADPGSGSIALLGSTATGSQPRFGLATPGNHLYVSNSATGQVLHYALDPGTGEPTSSFNAHSIPMPEALARTASTDFVFNATLSGQQLTAYSVNGQTGELTVTSALATGQENYFLAVHPGGKFLYTTGYLANSIIGAQFNPATGALSNPVQYPSAARPVAISIHSNGRFAFVPAYDGEQIQTYAIDQESGSLTQSSAVAKPGKPQYLTLLATHDGNDPPEPNAGQDRWVTVGQSAALHGHNTSDPDAVRCNADSSQYAATWTFVSRPGASALTDGDIVDASSLGSARFVPDVAGDYRLRLTFTDDPGSCNGVAKTRSAEVTIRAGYQHVSATVDVLDALPVAPQFDPVFEHTGTALEDWGGDMMWAVTLKADPVQYLLCVSLRNYFNNICTNPASWVVPPRAIAACAIRNASNCEAQFDLVYSIICMSPEAHLPDAQRFCEIVAQGRPNVLVNGTHVRVDLNRGHFWIRTRMRMHYVGRWRYWDYN